MEQGNNIQCLKTFRLKIPLFDQGTIGEPGHKYFFPDNPIFKDQNIVGIDVNCDNDLLQKGDLKATNDNNLGFLLPIGFAKAIYCTIYDQDGQEKFYNTPLRSFFMMSSVSSTGLKNPRRVKPYFGKINCRKSFLYIPVGIGSFTSKTYVSLNFYYN